jgi:hypothetical protein
MHDDNLVCGTADTSRHSQVTGNRFAQRRIASRVAVAEQTLWPTPQSPAR